MRLLDYLLAIELVADERSARGLIMRGDVLVNDRPVTSTQAEVPAEAAVRLRNITPGDVSRGAAKLRPAIERTGFKVAGRVCLDLGVSTGGFTQILLELGASRVYAVDVAYGITALSIRDDPRVVLLERINARLLASQQVPEPIERAVGDLSFISWSAVLPAIRGLLADSAELLLLIKPQFELAALGRAKALSSGVARDSAAVRESLIILYNAWVGNGLNPIAVVPAAVRGARGNQEYFVHLARETAPLDQRSYEELVDRALAEAQA